MWLSRAEKSQTVITIASEPQQRVWDFCFSLLDLSELKEALKSFLEFCLSTPAFSSIILFHIFVQAFGTSLRWKLQSIALEPGILWKRWFAWAFHKSFFPCYAIFTWNWTNKTHDLTDYQLIIGNFLQAITFMSINEQIPEQPHFFQQQLFSSVPSLVNFKCPIIFRSFHLNFLCANLAAVPQHQSKIPIFAAPVIWSILDIAVLCPPQLVSIVQSFLKAPPSSSSELRTVCFQNFSQDAYYPPLKTPLALSPACFNHSIILKASFSSHVVSICPHPSFQTIYYTEFLHAPLPPQNQLHLSIVSTVVCLLNSPAHSLESAISKHLWQVLPLNDKKLPCAGLGQEL